MAVAVVQVGSYSSNLTPSLGTSICGGHGPKEIKRQEKKKKKERNDNDSDTCLKSCNIVWTKGQSIVSSDTFLYPAIIMQRQKMTSVLGILKNGTNEFA